MGNFLICLVKQKSRFLFEWAMKKLPKFFIFPTFFIFFSLKNKIFRYFPIFFIFFPEKMKNFQSFSIFKKYFSRRIVFGRTKDHLYTCTAVPNYLTQLFVGGKVLNILKKKLFEKKFPSKSFFQKNKVLVYWGKKIRSRRLKKEFSSKGNLP